MMDTYSLIGYCLILVGLTHGILSIFVIMGLVGYIPIIFALPIIPWAFTCFFFLLHGKRQKERRDLPE